MRNLLFATEVKSPSASFGRQPNWASSLLPFTLTRNRFSSPSLQSRRIYLVSGLRKGGASSQSTLEYPRAERIAKEYGADAIPSRIRVSAENAEAALPCKENGTLCRRGRGRGGRKGGKRVEEERRDEEKEKGANEEFGGRELGGGGGAKQLEDFGDQTLRQAPGEQAYVPYAPVHRDTG